jgi:SP family sugar:H+ symporter-like MFS transporter
MGYLKAPKFKLNRESLGLTNYVRYDKFAPQKGEAVDDDTRSLAGLDYSPLKRVTWESFWMGILISMGGMIFGYDTGQISGFLAMPDFRDRFGQRHHDGTHYFSNVRSGLIVSLVCLSGRNIVVSQTNSLYSFLSVP